MGFRSQVSVNRVWSAGFGQLRSGYLTGATSDHFKHLKPSIFVRNDVVVVEPH